MSDPTNKTGLIITIICYTNGSSKGKRDLPSRTQTKGLCVFMCFCARHICPNNKRK